MSARADIQAAPSALGLRRTADYPRTSTIAARSLIDPA